MVKNKRMKERKVKAFYQDMHAIKRLRFSMLEFIKKQFDSSCSLNSTPVSKWLVIKYSERSIRTSANMSLFLLTETWENKHNVPYFDLTEKGCLVQ